MLHPQLARSLSVDFEPNTLYLKQQQCTILTIVGVRILPQSAAPPG